jgi:hypothetical protein
MADMLRVIQYGLGPIGSAMARHVVERAGLELAGAVDVDPAKVGRDAGEVMGLGRSHSGCGRPISTCSRNRSAG